jgi:hypothetical protein
MQLVEAAQFLFYKTDEQNFYGVPLPVLVLTQMGAAGKISVAIETKLNRIADKENQINGN